MDQGEGAGLSAGAGMKRRGCIWWISTGSGGGECHGFTRRVSRSVRKRKITRWSIEWIDVFASAAKRGQSIDGRRTAHQSWTTPDWNTAGGVLPGSATCSCSPSDRKTDRDRRSGHDDNGADDVLRDH